MAKKIPGTLVWNPYLQRNMHKLRDYDKDGETRALYSDMLPKFVAHLKRRLKNHRQNIIAIDGGTGSGKSTIMILAASLQDKQFMTDPEGTFKDTYVYYKSDMAGRLDRIISETNKCNINLFDEGSVILNSTNGRKTEDNDLIVLFDILRSWGMTTYVCVPDYNDLNNKFKAHLIDYRISCPDEPLVPGYNSRGFYEIYKPSKMTFAKGVWWQCIGAGVYGPLPKKLDEPYQAIKREHQVAQTQKYIEKYLKGGQ